MINNVMYIDVMNILCDGEFVGTLSKLEAESGDYYTFNIDWKRWDEVKPRSPIAGVGIDARLDEYVRDYLPEFLTDYFPPKGREDTKYLMKKVGLTGEYDIWEYAKKQHRFGRDCFTVEQGTLPNSMLPNISKWRGKNFIYVDDYTARLDSILKEFGVMTEQELNSKLGEILND